MTFSLTTKTAAQRQAEAAATIQAEMVSHIDNLVEETAQSKDYKNAASLAGYKDSTVAAWAAEASAFIDWRDDVWVAAYAILSDVLAGEREIPTPAEMLAEMPAIVWP